MTLTGAWEWLKCKSKCKCIQAQQGRQLVCQGSVAVQAAVSVARRVAEEQGCEVGAEVGYAVRFEQRVSSRTRITYLTGKPVTYSTFKSLVVSTVVSRARPVNLCF